MAHQRLADCRDACDGTEVILVSVLATLLGYQLAEHMRVPLVRAYFAPSRLHARPHLPGRPRREAGSQTSSRWRARSGSSGGVAVCTTMGERGSAGRARSTAASGGRVLQKPRPAAGTVVVRVQPGGLSPGRRWRMGARYRLLVPRPADGLGTSGRFGGVPRVGAAAGVRRLRQPGPTPIRKRRPPSWSKH